VTIMSKQTSSRAQRATRWWSAPARFTADTIALLRTTTMSRARMQNRWLLQAPVGIRASLDAQP
jgi:hypothetical protein